MEVSSGRIVKFDNLKGLAIFLIVLGHLTFYREYDGIYFIRNIVFLFHIPIFFFTAGYFSKIGPDEPIKAFKRLFIPYILFCVIWEIFNTSVMGKPMNNPIFIDSGFALWFLISLFIMKMILPIIDRFRFPLMLSIICALLVGFIDTDALGITRMFCYMPIFLIGFYYNDYKQMAVQKLPVIENNKFTILMLVFTILLSVAVALTVPEDMVRMKFVYDEGLLYEIITRLLLIMVTSLNVLVLTRFMTNRELIITQFGVNSLTVYLLHPYIVKLTILLAKPYFKGHPKLVIIFILIIAFIITYILSRNIFTNALNKILKWIYNIHCIE